MLTMMMTRQVVYNTGSQRPLLPWAIQPASRSCLTQELHFSWLRKYENVKDSRPTLTLDSSSKSVLYSVVKFRELDMIPKLSHNFDILEHIVTGHYPFYSNRLHTFFFNEKLAFLFYSQAVLP